MITPILNLISPMFCSDMYLTPIQRLSYNLFYIDIICKQSVFLNCNQSVTTKKYWVKIVKKCVHLRPENLYR